MQRLSTKSLEDGISDSQKRKYQNLLQIIETVASEGAPLKSDDNLVHNSLQPVLYSNFHLMYLSLSPEHPYRDSGT